MLRAHPCARGATDPQKRQVCRKLVLLFAPKLGESVEAFRAAWARGLAPGAGRIAACSSEEGAPGVLVHRAARHGSASWKGTSARDTLELRGDCKPLSMGDIHRTLCLYRLP